MLRTNLEARSAADRLETMLYSASLNKNLADRYMEELAERGDTLMEEDLEGAKLEDFDEERIETEGDAEKPTHEIQLSDKQRANSPQGESRLVLLSDTPEEKYHKHQKRVIKQDSPRLNVSKAKLRSASPPHVFFTESPDRSESRRVEDREGRWEPLSYTAMGDMGFKFKVAPGGGELWGRSVKMWKPIN